MLFTDQASAGSYPNHQACFIHFRLLTTWAHLSSLLPLIKSLWILKELTRHFYFETPFYLKIEKHDQYSNIDHTPPLPGLTIINIYNYYVIFCVVIFPFFTMSRSNLAEAPRLVKQSAIISLPDTASIFFSSPSSKLSFKAATSILNL